MGNFRVLCYLCTYVCIYLSIHFMSLSQPPPSSLPSPTLANPFPYCPLLFSLEKGTSTWVPPYPGASGLSRTGYILTTKAQPGSRRKRIQWQGTETETTPVPLVIRQPTCRPSCTFATNVQGV